MENMDINKKVSIMYNFTQAYIQNKDMPVSIREASCIKVQFPALFNDIQQGDLFAGRLEYLPICFSPQAPGGLGYVFNEYKINDMLHNSDLIEENKGKLIEICDFWRNNSTKYKTRAAYPDYIQEALPSDLYSIETGVAFPLYRLGGTQMDFGKLLRNGIVGMDKEIEQYEKKASSENKDISLYQGMRMALDVLVDTCLYYKAQAEKMACLTDDMDWKAELGLMAKALGAITKGKPATFREAIQLMLLYALISGTYNYGRMDTYLADFYTHDVSNNIINESEALKLLQGLWRLLDAQNKKHDIRVIIGGLGRSNEKSADLFALLAMEATRTVVEVTPQLTLRFYKGMNPSLMEKALEVIGEGRTYPMLYNDDVNVPAVMKAFNVDYQEALDYVPYGCGEYTIYHKGIGTPSGVINVLKALEVTLYNGIDAYTGKRMGLALGELSSFEGFEDFYAAYCKQIEYHINALAVQQKIEYDVAGEDAAFLFLSMLHDDCIERGKALLSGGVRYLGGIVESYGNTNAADSLTAIKELVFDKKVISCERLLTVLSNDFEGYEKERKTLQGQPKYGNDDAIADSMAIELHNFVCNVARKQNTDVGLHSYMIVLINNSVNTTLGALTHASADGRKKGEYMANANNPFNGMDRNGVTAMLNSLVKLDCTIHAGSVQNIKFSKEMFGKHKPKLISLLNTYFEMGGTQIMITVLNKDDLENAMKEPEKYSNLIIRVGGYSARFVDLPHNIQKEILSRTLY